MKWRTLDDKFPDDWERKILRTAGTKIVLNNSDWILINSLLWNSEKKIAFEYTEIEYLDETPSEEPNQGEQGEMISEIGTMYVEYGFGNEEWDEFVIRVLTKYSIQRK